METDSCGCALSPLHSAVSGPGTLTPLPPAALTDDPFHLDRPGRGQRVGTRWSCPAAGPMPLWFEHRGTVTSPPSRASVVDVPLIASVITWGSSFVTVWTPPKAAARAGEAVRGGGEPEASERGCARGREQEDAIAPGFRRAWELCRNHDRFRTIPWSKAPAVDTPGCSGGRRRPCRATGAETIENTNRTQKGDRTKRSAVGSSVTMWLCSPAKGDPPPAEEER